ncbi:choline dehydrogenase 7 [Borealophlyctis nickersoniae]|nr:choline dehydrogenase 7 [Borealophlyctis nickersoniae]
MSESPYDASDAEVEATAVGLSSDPFDSASSLSDIEDGDSDDDSPLRGEPPANGDVSDEDNAAHSFAEEDEDEPMEDAAAEESDDYQEDNARTRKAKQNRKQKAKAAAESSSKNGKTVPYDPVIIPMGDPTTIEKLISWRVVDGREEILVKYKNMSYYHAAWLDRSVAEQGKTGKMRVKRFMDKPSWEVQWSEDEPFNPNFLKIDRLIDEGELGTEVFYLTKWCAQTYDACTWEKSEIVEQLDAEKITEFNERRTVNPEKAGSYATAGKRPSPKHWVKLEESPVYKNENTLRPYQLEGLNWLLFCWFHRQNSILADEMGLGKTVQSTVFLDALYRDQNVKGPFLIVTPLSTIGNWEREIKTWTDMNVVVYHGRDVARNLIVDTEFYYRNEKGGVVPNIFKFDIILTTYEMAMSGAAHLRPIKWRCVVLDEAHRLKNKASKVSDMLKSYKMEHRVLLTGTPLQNSLDELWSLLNFLEPEKFASEKEFQDNYGSLSSAGDVEKLQALLKPLMLRRLKEDVEKSIPVKEETIVEVELTTMQKKWYKSIHEKNFAWLKQGSKKTNLPNLINTMIELRKCCIHPFLLKGAEEQIIKENGADTFERQFDILIQASGKMVLIDKLLKKLKAGGHKVLIFSQMTRCLDLIQDYLRGRQWLFERIDGSVRGDLRQAAIDRFSAPGSECFVFLLCTRAGGVGINLTAADTCIIFDSDWNPQNDLQAQSRCHRIGQKKPVQIYRLITRNTYERVMFDRASMKLGLDKAILQRMDAQNLGSGVSLDTVDMGKPPSSLSKTEIEELLKKGAYGAFMDDDASKQFCEEDIDSILERRTQVIRHDSTEEKSSIFSKASFSASNADNDVDMNDPDFWDKVAKKAHLHIQEVIPDDPLIIDMPRQRRQGLRSVSVNDALMSKSKTKDDFITQFNDLGQKEDLERAQMTMYDPTKARSGPAPDGAKPWALAEKARLERLLMMHGLGNWDEWTPVLNRRTLADIKACARGMVAHCLRLNFGTEPDVVSDAKAALIFTGEFPEEFLDPTNPPKAVPYENATAKQIYEYKSLLIEATPEYLEHIEKKSKNLLCRIAMMYLIRERIAPTKETKIPTIHSNPPARWWGEDEDRDLLIGVCKHGYQQYEKIRKDPELSFFRRTFENMELGPMDEDKLPDAEDQPTPADSDMDEDDEGPSGAVTENDAREIPSSRASPVPNTELPDQPPPQDDGHFPSASDLGTRLRRILAAFQRVLNAAAKEEAKKQQALERNRAKEAKEKRKTSKKDILTKSEKQEFYKTLVNFGVELDEQRHPVWTKFKKLAGIDKPDETLTKHYEKLMSMCDEVVGNVEEAACKVVDEASLAQLEEQDADRFAAVKVLERDGDTISYDKAKKVLKRIGQFAALRDEILPHKELEKRISVLKRHGRSGLPRWWTTEHDKGFLLGIARHGIHRSDLILEDPTLPFHELHEQYKKSLDVRWERKLAKDELVDGMWEESFWMSQPVQVRRFEALSDAVLCPPPPSSKAAAPTQASSVSKASDNEEYAFQSEGDFSFRNFKIRVSLGKDSQGNGHRSSSPASTPRKRKRAGRKASKREPVRNDSSGEDTDAMLQAARKTTSKSRRKKQRRDYESDTSDFGNSDEAFGATSHNGRHTGAERRGSSPFSKVPTEHAGHSHSKHKKHKKHKHKHDRVKRELEGPGSDREDDTSRKKHRRHKSDRHGKHKSSKRRAMEGFGEGSQAVRERVQEGEEEEKKWDPHPLGRQSPFPDDEDMEEF